MVCKNKVSKVLENFKNRQNTKQFLALEEYYARVRSVQESVSSKKIREAALKVNDAVATHFKYIDELYTQSIAEIGFDLDKLSSYKGVYLKIRTAIISIIPTVDDFYEQICEIEQKRIKNVNNEMSEAFLKLKSFGLWDTPTVIKFLDTHTFYYNRFFIDNFKAYLRVYGHLKQCIMQKIRDYYFQWQHDHLTCRDFLIFSNIKIIQTKFEDNEQMSAKLLAYWKNIAVKQIFKEGCQIATYLRKFSVILPYDRQKLLLLNKHLDFILLSLGRLRDGYLAKLKKLYNSLNSSIQSHLDDIKQRLFDDSESSGEKFTLMFADYMGTKRLETYYETRYKKEKDSMKQRIQCIRDGKSDIIGFLLTICDEWEQLKQKMATEDEELNNDLNKKRENHLLTIKLQEDHLDEKFAAIDVATSEELVNKLVYKIRSHLNQIRNLYSTFYKEIHDIIHSYPDKCIGHIRNYENEIYELMMFERPLESSSSDIAERKNAEEAHLPPSLDAPVDPLRLSSTATKENFQTQFDSIRSFAEKESIKHIQLYAKGIKEHSHDLALKLKKNMKQEQQLRIKFHAPRKKSVEEIASLRKKQLNFFPAKMENYLEKSVNFQNNSQALIAKHSKCCNQIVSTVETKIGECKKSFLSFTRSSILIEEYRQTEYFIFDEEARLSELSKEIALAMDNNYDAFKAADEELFKYAEEFHHDLSEDRKDGLEYISIRNKCKATFIHSKRSIRNQEIWKIKQLLMIAKEHKNYYRHCLVNLYYIEVKDLYLSTIRLRMKSIKSLGINNLREITEINNCIGKELEQFFSKKFSSSNVSKVSKDFKNILHLIKCTINFLNYRCSLPTAVEIMSMNPLEIGCEDVMKPGDIHIPANVAKEIFRISAQSKTNSPENTKQLISEDNWRPKRADVENKFIGSRLVCIYGVGVNVFDIGASNPQNKSPIQRNLRGKALSSSRLSQEIRKQRSSCRNWRRPMFTSLPDINPSSTTFGSSDIPRQQSSKMFGLDDMLYLTESKSSIEFNLLRKSSSATQVDLQKALSISMEPEMASKTKLNAFDTTVQKLTIHDFLTMDEEYVEKAIKQPVKFFCLKPRNYNVDKLADCVYSATEKAKYYLLHIQEDFLVNSIVFYRQKYLSIKNVQNIEPTIDQAMAKFQTECFTYLEGVIAYCKDNIQVIKNHLKVLYDNLEKYPQTVYSSLFHHFQKSFQTRYSKIIAEYKAELTENTQVQDKIWKSLRLSVAYPSNSEDLDAIISTENERKKKMDTINGDWFRNRFTVLEKYKEKFIETMDFNTISIREIVDFIIQIDDIRPITEDQEQVFAVKRRLRQELNQNFTTKNALPKSCSTVLEPKGNYSEAMNSAVRFFCVNVTKVKIEQIIQKKYQEYFNEYSEEIKEKLEILNDLNKKSIRQEELWTNRRNIRIREIKTLIKYSDFD